MIKKIKLNNFKSHKETEIKIGNLTVLCGSNGAGKSSLIQILLLLREAFLKDKSFDILDLKSNPIKIGIVNDAVYQFGEYDGFKVFLEFADFNCNFHYEANSEDDKVKSYIRLNKEKIINNESFNLEDDVLTSKIFSSQSLFNCNFQYLSAARFGCKAFRLS